MVKVALQSSLRNRPSRALPIERVAYTASGNQCACTACTKGPRITPLDSPSEPSKPLQTIAELWRLARDSLHVEILGQRSFDLFLICDQGRAAGGAMFNALANLKEDGETTSEKKSKRRNRKSKHPKQKSDVPKDMEILIKTGGQPGGGKGVWGVDKNIADELFPGAAEAARNQELEDEQLTMAVAASLESAFLEKCAIDPPEEDNVEAAKLSDDENIWDGVHKNLPSPSGEETVGDFDANNNSGSNKSRSSSVATRKSEGKVSSCEGSKAAAMETPSGAGKIDEPLTPAVVPNYIDKFGRVDGYTEKRLFMGKGARGKEDEYRRKLQQEHGNSANGPNQRPRNNAGSRDPRPRNGRQSVGNAGNDNRGAGNGPNGPYAHPGPRDPRRGRHGRSFGDYPRNDVGGPSTQLVIANLQQQHRGSQPTQGPHRLRNHQAQEDSRNDRQQGRFSRHENPDVRHNYREPYDPTRNPYKYTRGPDEPDKRISDKPDGERDPKENRTENANREGDEKKIQPLMSAPVEPPSFAAVQESARESSTPIEQTRPLVETPGEPQIKIEPGVSPKETAEFAGDPVKPQVHLKDFNSRYNTTQEQTTLQARPNPAGSNSFHSAATIAHTSIADASGQTSAIQFPPARFSVPPPGFGRLENTQGSSSNAAYVLPVDSSLGCSAYVVPAESTRTSSAYCLPADSASDSFSEIDEMEAVYSRIKMYDPMLYDLLMKKDQRRAARRSVQMNAIAYPTIPENCNVLPVDPRSFQATPASYDAPSEQRPSETLNPNAKQYSPITKQAWITHDQQEPMSCYSVPPNYDPQSAGVYCQYAGQPQDMIRQDNSGWIAAAPQQLYAPVHPGQHHGHYANEPNAPTAILGRQSLLVSEHNLPYKNAQRPMNLQQLNDDYTIRCQPSCFDDISTDPQRQVQYRASHHQCGVAPSQFCSMPCEGSYGNQTAMSKFVNYVQQAPHPLHQYAQFVAKNRNSINSMNQGNGCFFKDNDEQIRGFAQPGCGAREPNSINQTELRFVQPIIPPMSFSEKPGKGRGRGRRDNKQ